MSVHQPSRTVGPKALPAAAILLAHLLPLTLPFTSVSGRDWLACGVSCVVIIFAVGGGLHRYFAHRAFKTSRAFQLFLGVLAACFFGDPVGFAGKHRLHHRHADTERDVHSPRQGLWYCWIGHLLEERCTEQEVLAAAADLARYPELMWLHRYSFVPGTLAAGCMFLAGGYSLLVAGYVLSWCLMAIHAPALVNYVCHRAGNRRFETADGSTNNALVGLLLFGEGWHNNHHRYPGSARSGLEWYELDLLFGMLKALAWLGLVWDLREAPRTGTLRFVKETPCA
jgi:stearoyl-CoA desaturase (delta-9 desaturase)